MGCRMGSVRSGRPSHDSRNKAQVPVPRATSVSFPETFDCRNAKGIAGYAAHRSEGQSPLIDLQRRYSSSNPKSVIRKSLALSRTMFSMSSENPSAVSASMSSVRVIFVPLARSSSLRMDCAMLLTCGVGRFGSSVILA